MTQTLFHMHHHCYGFINSFTITSLGDNMSAGCFSLTVKCDHTIVFDSKFYCNMMLCCFLCQWSCVSPSLPQLIAILARWCWSVAAIMFSCLIHKPKVVLITDCFISLSPSRDCGSVSGTCKDESSIMYAWARNAPPTKLPKGLSVCQSCFHSEEMWVS